MSRRRQTKTYPITEPASPILHPASHRLIDCQSHLFVPEVVAFMRRRTEDPVVYDQDGVSWLKMGDWLRKIPPHYLSVEAKLGAMDASGILMTALSINDPGPEWFGADGPAVAQLM